MYPMRIAVGSILLSAMAVLAGAQEVKYDFSRSKDFAHVNSFLIKQEVASENPLVDRRIVANIASVLTARGLRQVERDPDVFVVPKMTVEMRKEITAYNTGYWSPYEWGYWGGG